MSNIIQAQDAIKSLQIENIQLKKKLTLVKVSTVFILFMMLIKLFVNNFDVLTMGVFVLVVFIAIYTIRYLNIEVKMNNFVILVTHSCIQKSYNNTYNPSNDTLITNKDLIS